MFVLQRKISTFLSAKFYANLCMQNEVIANNKVECSFRQCTVNICHRVAQNKPYYLTFQLSSKNLH